MSRSRPRIDPPPRIPARNTRPRARKGYVLPAGPPEPRTAIGVLRLLSDVYAMLDDTRKYGDFAICHSKLAFNYVIFHPELARRVLEDYRDVTDRETTSHALFQIAGFSLLTSDGERWEKLRRMLGPVWHAQVVDRLAPGVTRTAEDIHARFEEGVSFDVKATMEDAVLRMVTRAMLGSDTENDSVFHEAVLAGSKHISGRIRIPPQLSDLMYKLPLPSTLHVKRRMSEFHRLAEDFITEYRASPRTDGGLLSGFIEATDPETGYRMSNEDIRLEIFVNLLTAHHILSTGMMWLWHSMATYSKAAERVFAEIDEVIGDRVPTLDDLPDLVVTKQFILESLRLSPPFPYTARTTHTRCTFAGYEMPPRAGFLIGLMFIQRDPRWWDEPEEFKPERWVPGFRESLPPYVYSPFLSDAPTGCVAEHYAMMAMTLFLATIGRRWRLSLPEGYEPEMFYSFNRTIKGAMPMTPELRAGR